MKATLTENGKLDCLDETQLITRVQKGDTEAFTPIVLMYREKIYKLIHRWVHHHETAEDLCQEVFLKAWQALPGFRGGSLIYSWLYRIAVNCSKDFLRSQRRQIVFACEALPDNPDDVIRATRMHPSPDEILEKEELRSIISECVRQLPSPHRHVFYLHYRDGHSIREIASRLKKPEGTIKSHLYHARQKLQHMLRPYLQNEPFRWSKDI